MKPFDPARGGSVIVLAAALTLAFFASGAARAAERFPFEQELVLDVKPMAPIKRVPVISIASNGEARIDLWCRTVTGRVEFADPAIRITPDPLTNAFPRYMSQGQCTPERMQADEDTLAVLAQVDSWRAQGNVVILNGPTALRFRLSTH